MALGDVIARLAVSLMLETAAFQAGATITEKRTAQMQKRLQAFGDSMAGIGAKLSIGLTAPMIAFGAASVTAAKESAEAMGQVEAALASMGNVSGRTADQLAALAASQMATSLYDDDEILRKVTANLLTFGNVSGAVFDRAQQAVIDLSARLGTDLQSATILVGKAINDPANGLAALGKTGAVSKEWINANKEMIAGLVESGNRAKAQGIIIAELERQYSNSAQKMRDADPAAAAKMQFANLQEEVGQRLIPTLSRLMEVAVKVLDWFNGLSPATKDTIITFAAIATAVGPVLIALGSLISIGAPLLAFLGSLGPVLSIVGKALLLIGLNPVILGLAVVLGGIYAAWKNWDTIEPILRKLYQGAKKWIVEGLGWVLNWVLNPIATVQKAFFKLYDAVVGHSYIPDMVAGIAAEMKRLDAVMVAPVKGATSAAAEAFRNMAQEARQVLDRLFPEAAAALRYQAERAALVATGAGEAALRALAAERDNARKKPAAVDFGGAGGPIAAVDDGLKQLETFLDRTEKRTREGTVRIAKSFKDMADETVSALGNLSNAIRSGGFLGILESVIGLGLQLGSVGVFGSRIAANVNRSVPGYANGTGFHPGGLAIVGERGPELVSMPRGSRVTPNGQFGGGIAQIVPSPYFDVVVDGRIQTAAPAIASAGAQGGVSRMAYSSTRRLA